MKTTETYRSLTTKIKALNDYLNSECTAFYFLYNWRAKDELLAIIDTLELKLSTLIDLDQFDISIHLTEGQTRVIEIALNKEYVAEIYPTI